MATTSSHYNLYIGEANDNFNPLTQMNQNTRDIDSGMWANKLKSVQTATELKSGTVHALTRNVPDAEMFRFTATSDYTSGDTFTVDGSQVSGVLPNGQPLPTGAYLINSEVLCCLVGTKLTFFIGGGGGGGEDYATTEYVDTAVAGVRQTATAAQQSAVAAGQLAQTANGAATAAQSDIDALTSDIDYIKVVSSLPSSPVARTLYLILE